MLDDEIDVYWLPLLKDCDKKQIWTTRQDFGVQTAAGGLKNLSLSRAQLKCVNQKCNFLLQLMLTDMLLCCSGGTGPLQPTTRGRQY